MRAVFEAVNGRGLAVWQDRHGMYVLLLARPTEVLQADDVPGLYIWGGHYDPDADAFDRLAGPTAYCLSLDAVLSRKTKGKRLIRIVDPEFGRILTDRGLKVRAPLNDAPDAVMRARGLRQFATLGQLDALSLSSVLTEFEWTLDALDGLATATSTIRGAYAQAMSVWRSDDPEVATARGVAQNVDEVDRCLRGAVKASDDLRDSMKRVIKC